MKKYTFNQVFTNIYCKLRVEIKNLYKYIKSAIESEKNLRVLCEKKNRHLQKIIIFNNIFVYGNLHVSLLLQFEFVFYSKFGLI